MRHKNVMNLAEQVSQYENGKVLKVVNELLQKLKSSSSIYLIKDRITRGITKESQNAIEEKLMVLQNTLKNSELPRACPCVFDKILTILDTAFPHPSVASEVAVAGDVLDLLKKAILFLPQQEEIDSKIEMLNSKLETIKNSFNAFQNEIANDKEKCQKVRENAEAYLEKIKKIYGAVSTTAKVGIASAEAKHNGRKCFWLSAASIALLLAYIGYFFWQPAPMVLSEYFLYRLSFAIPVAALSWYLASLAQKYRERGFQQKDFELNTSTLNGVLQAFGISDGGLNEVDRVKLELLKSFYDRQIGNDKNCGTQISNEAVKMICEIIKTALEVKKS